MINPVQSEQDIKTVVKLANTIWHEHYSPMIGSDQVSYMLENFHSEAAVKDELTEQNYLYFLINHDGRSVGYMGVQPKDGVLFLSKLYLLSSERSQGLGRTSIAYLVDLAETLELPKIQLTVHKNNNPSIKAYEKMGFKNIDTVMTDIGGGYVMDDVVMELTL